MLPAFRCFAPLSIALALFSPSAMAKPKVKSKCQKWNDYYLAHQEDSKVTKALEEQVKTGKVKCFPEFLDYLKKNLGSANEENSAIMAYYYVYNPNIVLENLNKLPASLQQEMVASLGFGLANAFYKKVTNADLPKKIVGSHPEVLKPSYKYYDLAKKVEKATMDETNG